MIETLCKETDRLLKPIGFMNNDFIEISTSVDRDDTWIVQTYCIRADGTRGPASHTAGRAWFHRLPERRELGWGRWAIRATDFSAIVIKSIWPEDKVTFLDDMARMSFDWLCTRFIAQTVDARVKARFKEHGFLPELPRDYKDHPTLPLMPYQTCGVLTSIDREATALFMEQGVGKTPIAIRRFMYEANHVADDEGRMYRCIIVAPRNVRTNWRNEILRFATEPGKVVILKGGQLQRVKQLVDIMSPDETAKFAAVICSYETVQRSWDALRMVEWDLCIADESHLIKSPSTKRAQTMLKLRDNAKQRMILTGTPVGNTIVDLWSQLEFLGKGLSGFTSVKNFRAFYCKFEETHNDKHRKVIGFKNLPVLHERLARIAYFVRKSEVMPDLPEKTYDVEEVSMSPDQLKVYTQMQKDLAVEIENDLNEAEESGNTRITANNVLTKLLRLSQITAGYVVRDQEFTDDGEEKFTYDDRTWCFERNPKIDQLVEDLKQRDPLAKTIVWTNWVPLIKMLSIRLQQENIKHVTFYGGTRDDDRERAELLFNRDPSVRVFVGNPAAGGIGLNLPGYVPDWEGTDKDPNTNADWTVFLSCNWSFLQRSQAEDRNHGKARCRVPIRITDFIVPGTIDDEIRAAVLAKKDAAMQIQDVREMMKRILNTQIDSGD